MDQVIDRGRFYKTFSDRAIVVTRLPEGVARVLAERANETAGRGDASLQTRAEYSVLFDLLVRELGSDPAAAVLTIADEQGRPTQAGQAVGSYRAVAMGKDEFFDQEMYLVSVTGWPPEKLMPEDPVRSPAGARFALWATDPADARHIPPPHSEGVLYATPTFSMVNSGNRTLRVPKRSWKIDLAVGDAENDRIVGMSHLDLKAMYNDPSQMREALAWRLFRRAGVPASRHTYAKLAINSGYRGLFSVIEEVDRRYLKDRFGDNDRGNLYKANCGDLGCATLEHRVGANGDDSGRQYRATRGEQTYVLKTNEDNQGANTYDDLARLVRVVNGVGLPGGDSRFDSATFRESVEQIMNVRCFLRWASVNLLIGSWDNYFATPSNFLLYNSGRRGDERNFVESPYFTFLPWDYDNSFGIDYFDTKWQYTDIVDWPSNTRNYWRKNKGSSETSRIPLVQNMLRNRDLLRYYLDHLEHLLDTDFSPDAVGAQIGPDGGGLWDRVRQPAYLESDTPEGAPFTGRQFSNNEVYLNASKQNEFRRGDSHIEGIHHYVRMRYDSARQQLAELRRLHPRGASGAAFPGTVETLPERV